MELFEADQKRIATAVAEAEQRSSGEIVCVLARSSSDYAMIPLVWAACIALITPAPLIAFTELSAHRIYLLQIMIFAIAAIILSLPALRFYLVPRRIKRARAYDMALRQFRMREVASTSGRTGILIFVSLAERYARIVVDDAVAAAIEQAQWQQAVDELVDAMREGRVADGYVAAVRHCGDLLAAHFQHAADDRDELPNRIILL